MHRCLLVQEIVYNVFTELSMSAGSTLRLALASKHLLELGLDELWRTQESLLPLVKCFPSDSWTIRDIDPPQIYAPSVTAYYFTRPLMPEDWTRFVYYSRRIKILGDPWFHGMPTVSMGEIWEMLAMSRPPNIAFLLPNLREISSQCEILGIFSNIRLLLPPNLSTLRMSWSAGNRTKLALLLAMPAICPQLTHLDLSYATNDVPSISKALERYPSLQILQLKDINYAILEQAAFLPSLKEFSAEMALLAREQLSLGPGAFPELVALKMGNACMPVATNLISSISSSNLRSLLVEFHSTSDPEHHRWDRFTGALKRLGNSLTRLIVTESWTGTDTEMYPRDRPPSPIDPEALLQLRELKKLTSLTITSKPFDMSDELLHKLTLAWPEMRELSLANRYAHQQAFKSIKLDDLLPLTIHCPKLERLTLFMDASIAPKRINPRKTHGLWRPNPNLVLLDTLHSPISNTVPVACFLSKVFPELRSICSSQSMAAPFRLWNEVLRHLRVVHQLRNEPESDVDDNGSG